MAVDDTVSAASARSGEGWERVVTRLVAERGDALTRYAFLLSGSADDAADLVQDALVRTFGRLRNGFSVSSAEAYVRRAILNGYLDGGRKRSRFRKIAHLALTPESDESPAAASADRLDLRGAVDAARAPRAILPRPPVLRRLEGRRHCAVARDQLGRGQALPQRRSGQDGNRGWPTPPTIPGRTRARTSKEQPMPGDSELRAWMHGERLRDAGGQCAARPPGCRRDHPAQQAPPTPPSDRCRRRDDARGCRHLGCEHHGTEDAGAERVRLPHLGGAQRGRQRRRGAARAVGPQESLPGGTACRPIGSTCAAARSLPFRRTGSDSCWTRTSRPRRPPPARR